MEGVLFYSWVNEKVRVLEGGRDRQGGGGAVLQLGE